MQNERYKFIVIDQDMAHLIVSVPITSLLFIRAFIYVNTYYKCENTQVFRW